MIKIITALTLACTIILSPLHAAHHQFKAAPCPYHSTDVGEVIGRSLAGTGGTVAAVVALSVALAPHILEIIAAYPHSNPAYVQAINAHYSRVQHLTKTPSYIVAGASAATALGLYYLAFRRNKCTCSPRPAA